MSTIHKYDRYKDAASGGNAGGSPLNLSLLANYVTHTQLSTTLQGYLPRVEFDEMFERVVREDGTWFIRAKADFLGVGEITAYGGNGNAGGGDVPGVGVGATRLRFLEDVLLPEAGIADESVLTYDAQTGMWIAKQVKSGLDTSELAAYLREHDYARLSDIPALPDLSIYATEDWVIGKGYALASALDNYVTIATPQEVSGQKRFSQSILLGTAEDYIELSYSGGAFRVNTNFVAAGEVTAYGSADFETFGGARKLDDLTDVSLGAIAVGDVLSWDGSKWVNKAISQGLDESALATYLSGHGYITNAALGNYVSKAGDSMTGALNMAGTNKILFNGFDFGIYADNYLRLKTAAGTIVFNDTMFRCDDSLNGKVALGGATSRWANLYADTINVSSTALVSNLNADMLDGYHEGSFFRQGRGHISDDYYNGTTYQNLNPGTYIYNYGGASGMLISFGNLGASASSLEFYTRYQAGDPIYFRKKIDSNRFASGWQYLITSYNIGSVTAGAANKLATARSIYGVDFDGSANVNGAFFWRGSDATLRIYETTGRDSAEGFETLCLQSCFDGQDPLTSNYVTAHAARCVLALQPRGGRVAVGKTTADYPLDVNGTARVTKLIIGSVTLSDENGALVIDKNVLGKGEITAYGNGSSGVTGGGGGVAYNRLDAWTDYTADKAGYVLSAKLGYDLYSNYLSKAAAAQAYQPKGDYLTPSNYASTLDARYVNTAGDTMTGALTVPKINITGTANSSAHITADDDDNIYINVGGRTPLVITNGGVSVRPALSQNGVWSLGESGARWKTVYAGTGNFSGAIMMHSGSGTELQMGGGGSGYVWFDCRQGGSMVNNFMMYPDYTLFNKRIQATSFVRTGGTSTQILMADGSVQSYTSLIRGYGLAAQNLDANNLTTDWMCYNPNGDMNSWGGTTFSNFPFAKPAGGFCLLNMKEGNYRKQIATQYNDNHIYIRRTHYNSGVTWSGWSTVALTSDNVASASKLANTRYLWGNAFNGEGDVAGMITSYQSYPMAFRTLTGTCDWLFHSDGNHFYITQASAKGQTAFGAYRPVALRNDGWIGLAGWAIVAQDGGNVGIGYNTYTPTLSCKLNVNGAIAVHHPDYHAINLRRTTSGAYGCSIGFTTGEGAFVGDVGFDGNKYFNVRNASGTTLIAALQNGNVGFGTTAPAYKVDIAGNMRATSNIELSSYGSFRRWANNNNGSSWNMGEAAFATGIVNNGNQTPLLMALRAGAGWDATGANRLFAMEFLNSGSVLRYCFGGAHRFEMHSNGNFLATGEVTAYSDERLKSGIEAITKGKRLRPVTFYKDGSRHVGLIAQDVQRLCPEAVTIGDDPLGLLSLNYSGALCYGFAGVYNELDSHEARIRELERDNQALKMENEYLKQQINNLERRLVA